MKTSQDPRHQKRQHLIQFLYSQTFRPQPTEDSEKKEILEKLSEVDEIIEKIAPEYPVEKINKVDLSVLRLAVFELAFEKKAPEKVIIDEAVELAKEFGGETSPAFINGALGNLLKKNKQ